MVVSLLKSLKMKTYNYYQINTIIRHTVVLIFLFLASILFPSRVWSQQNEGVVRYLKTYNWVKMMAAVDYLSKEQKDRASYMWGNNSEWKMYTTLYFSPKRSKYEDSEEKAEKDYEGYSWRKDAFDITRNFENNTIKNILTMLGKVYIIEDTLIAQDWKILNDIKEVAGHICMNASWNDTLKKQMVIAWFALDLPVSAGPEQFCGLPGLILEVNINDGAAIITADKIENKTLTTEFDLPKKIKGKKIKEQDYLVIVKKHYDDRRKAEEPPFWGVRY
jgi:GLPGLI family protein